jgi:hypothetical protein
VPGVVTENGTCVIYFDLRGRPNSLETLLNLLAPLIAWARSAG